jgi:hypothetical protein
MTSDPTLGSEAGIASIEAGRMRCSLGLGRRARGGG